MASGIPWESLDYYSRMAAKHSVGVDLLPSSDCSTRIRRRTLERIKRTVFPIDGGASDDASCGARRRTGSLDCRLSPDKRRNHTCGIGAKPNITLRDVTGALRCPIHYRSETHTREDRKKSRPQACAM